MLDAPFMARMQAAMLLPAYKNAPRAWKTGLNWPLNQIFANPAYKLIYCPIGKNACTFLKRQMAQLSNHPELDILLGDIHLLTGHVNTGLLLGDYLGDEAHRLMHDPEAFRFAVLRDPMQRLLSAYVEKYVYTRNAPGNIGHARTLLPRVQDARGQTPPDYDQGISFGEFVDAVVDTPPLGLDAHWHP